MFRNDVPNDYITKFDEIKVCFIHTSNDLSESAEREMQNIMRARLTCYGIIDESEFSELTAEIRQDKAHNFSGILQIKDSERN